MLSLFRTNQIAFNLLLIVYVVILRGSAFIVEPPVQDFTGQGFFSDWVYSLLGNGGVYCIIGGILIVFIQSLLINLIVAKFRMATAVSLFPGLFYILLVSLIPEFLALSPVLLANTFFILAIWELYETYRRHEVAGNIVNIGFWIGIASLFYFSEMVFLLMGLFGLNVLRAFRIRELIMMLIGFIIPYILICTWFFWTDRLGFFWETYITNQLSFIDIRFDFGIPTYVNLGLIILFILVVLFSSNSYFSKKSIQAQKNITVLYWAIFFAFIALVFQNALQYHHLLIIMVPVSILLSFNFFNMKPRVAEAIHLLLFAVVLIWQFHSLWLR